MSVRKRAWMTSKGDRKEAWIVDYVDRQGNRPKPARLALGSSIQHPGSINSRRVSDRPTFLSG